MLRFSHIYQNHYGVLLLYLSNDKNIAFRKIILKLFIITADDLQFEAAQIFFIQVLGTLRKINSGICICDS